MNETVVVANVEAVVAPLIIDSHHSEVAAALSTQQTNKQNKHVFT